MLPVCVCVLLGLKCIKMDINIYIHFQQDLIFVYNISAFYTTKISNLKSFILASHAGDMGSNPVGA